MRWPGTNRYTCKHINIIVLRLKITRVHVGLNFLLYIHIPGNGTVISRANLPQFKPSTQAAWRIYEPVSSVIYSDYFEEILLNTLTFIQFQYIRNGRVTLIWKRIPSSRSSLTCYRIKIKSWFRISFYSPPIHCFGSSVGWNNHMSS